jgi:hypothetical protein
MSRARAVAVILALVVLPAVVLVAHLTRPMLEPVPEPLVKQAAYDNYLHQHCPGIIHAVFRKPEPCSCAWDSDERGHGDDKPPRMLLLDDPLKHLAAEREQHAPATSPLTWMRRWMPCVQAMTP